MATTPPDTNESNIVPALVQLLRRRSYEEIRERMYDNPPGTPWWAACKAELDIRNSERLATSVVDNSRVSTKIRSSAEHMEKLTETLVEVTADVADVVRGVKASSRRMELATYVIVGVVIAQLFYVAFLVLGKR
ncbi:MAG: hypothetical protein WAQ52_13145 [Terriglobales bacterium]